MPQRLHHLERLSAVLGDAVTVDDVARAALTEMLGVDEVTRAGLAVSQGAGRELSFVSTDDDALGPESVRWCKIDGLADVPLARSVRTSAPVYLLTADDLEREFPDLAERQRRLHTQSMVSVPMQRSLMPHSLPELPGLALGAHYRPGGLNVDVGGDWYDVMTLPDGSVVIMLGDVMGKGVPAAIVMSEVRSATRAYALLDPDPSLVLERLEAVVSATPHSDQIVTLLYGVVDPERRRVRLAVAGHPPPMLVSPEGRPELLDAAMGPALGLGVGPWPTSVVELEERATMLRTSEADDDVTLLAVTASAPQPTASHDLPADASAAGLARGFVASVLREWSVDGDVVETAQLCVSELVTNAIIHSGTTSTVTVGSDGDYILVMVQDRGSRGPVRRPADLDPEAISGRGLSLVDALASAWSSEHSTDGSTVWFELELNPVQDWESEATPSRAL